MFAFCVCEKGMVAYLMGWGVEHQNSATSVCGKESPASSFVLLPLPGQPLWLWDTAFKALIASKEFPLCMLGQK